MMKKLLLLPLVLASTPAFAQQNCGNSEQIHRMLSEQYRESRQVVGVVNEQSVLEVWANTESGTWTILITRTNGMSCLAAYGISYTTAAPVPEGTMN